MKKDKFNCRGKIDSYKALRDAGFECIKAPKKATIFWDMIIRLPCTRRRFCQTCHSHVVSYCQLARKVVTLMLQ